MKSLDASYSLCETKRLFHVDVTENSFLFNLTEWLLITEGKHSSSFVLQYCILHTAFSPAYTKAPIRLLSFGGIHLANIAWVHGTIGPWKHIRYDTNGNNAVLTTDCIFQ